MSQQSGPVSMQSLQQPQTNAPTEKRIPCTNVKPQSTPQPLVYNISYQQNQSQPTIQAQSTSTQLDLPQQNVEQHFTFEKIQPFKATFHFGTSKTFQSTTQPSKPFTSLIFSDYFPLGDCNYPKMSHEEADYTDSFEYKRNSPIQISLLPSEKCLLQFENVNLYHYDNEIQNFVFIANSILCVSECSDKKRIIIWNNSNGICIENQIINENKNKIKKLGNCVQMIVVDESNKVKIIRIKFQNEEGGK